ncbi:hypothetical protein DFH08DRAFT_862618 [Mycena albidolilacea]|uniref:UspA domain-containing protein n=1 Tax=Mycena albidolilacea TaxID=1033008 RepID=A0AAD7A731_9AGAR|nr:hypothetical protein DFH08DRAFT_862618 [Mycena albidolilacea]
MSHSPPLYSSTPGPPLRSAMKHTSSYTSSPPRSPSPASLISPVLVSPPSLPVPLPSASPSPHPAGGSSPHIGTSTHASPHLSTPSVLSPTPLAAAGYTPKVSFDTFENPVASMFSFTLAVKSGGFARTRSTRVFLCAAGPDESGREALDWSLEALVQDGDELIVCRGIEEDVFEKGHESVREEARALMREIQEKSVEYDPERKLSLILEFIPGRITTTLDRLIALYRPDSVVVGTRGKKAAWQGMATMGMMGKGGIGSVSKYCLTHSPVPIIVVRPERKVKKAVEKRRADPKRGTHFGGDEGDRIPPPISRNAKTYNVIGSVPLGSRSAAPGEE